MANLYIRDELIAKNVEFIIFDKDGTLIDAHHYWYSMISLRADRIIKKYIITDPNAKNEIIKSMGGNTFTGRLFPDGPVGIKPREFIVDATRQCLLNYKIFLSNDDIELIFKEVDQYSSENLLPFLKLLPGVLEYLDRSQKCGVKMAVATTDMSYRAKAALESLSLAHFFNWIVGGDNVKNKKPAPDLGQLLLEKSAISAMNTIMVGDHAVDILMGRECNMKCIGVATGMSSYSELEKCSKYVINNFLEMDIKND